MMGAVHVGWISNGAIAGGVIGAIAGLVLGLMAHPATAPFAVIELGVPGAVLGVLIGTAAALVEAAIARALHRR